MACKIPPSISGGNVCQKCWTQNVKKKRHYSISFVERFGHNVLIIRDEAIKTKHTKRFLRKDEGRFHSTDREQSCEHDLLALSEGRRQ